MHHFTPVTTTQLATLIGKTEGRICSIFCVHQDVLPEHVRTLVFQGALFLISELTNIILVTFVTKNHVFGVDRNCPPILKDALCLTFKLSPAIWAKFFCDFSHAIFSF